MCVNAIIVRVYVCVRKAFSCTLTVTARARAHVITRELICYIDTRAYLYSLLFFYAAFALLKNVSDKNRLPPRSRNARRSPRRGNKNKIDSICGAVDWHIGVKKKRVFTILRVV